MASTMVCPRMATVKIETDVEPGRRSGERIDALAPEEAPPNFDVTNRNVLRSRYRELKSDVDGRKGELAQADFQEFKDIVNRVENLHKYARKTREQITDAELLNDMTTEIHDVAKGARINGGMSAAEFVEAIAHVFRFPGVVDGGEPRVMLDWKALGLQCCTVLQDVTGVSTVIGSMDVQLKQRKPTVRRKRERPADETNPEEVEEVDADRPSTETDANMSIMFEYLIEKKKIEISRLVFNRLSFAQTVENLFALSFLVKDGRVEIKVLDDGNQVAIPRNAPSHSDRAYCDVRNTQFVFRLDFRCWRLMHDIVLQGSEIMPHRSHRSSGGPGTSRTPIRKNSRNRARETPVITTQTEDTDEDSRERRSG